MVGGERGAVACHVRDYFKVSVGSYWVPRNFQFGCIRRSDLNVSSKTWAAPFFTLLVYHAKSTLFASFLG
jgi:hypothetical protein